jgi:hypothetical protein
MAYPTNDTFASLIDEVITSLQGYGTDNDQVATLTQGVGVNDLTFSVDDSDELSRGLIEIDTEIMYVQAADNGTVVIQPWGRGFKGTVATAHTANSMISVAPTWPRAVVAREVNNTVRAVYPDLFGIGTLDLTTTAVTWQYAVPAVIDRVLSVEYRWIDVTEGWMPIDGWELIQSANTSDFYTGKALLINDPLPAGCIVHIVYAKPPTFLVNPTDSYSVTGLPASSRDVIVYGAASRLLPWQDASRVSVETVSSDAQDQTKPVGNGLAVAGELRKLYTLRLESERKALMQRYPSRTHRVR